MGRWEFDILEIPVTQDTKEIKRAYAKQVKKYHPEDSPEEWEELHKAYKAALDYAKYAQMLEEDCEEPSSLEWQQYPTEQDAEDIDGDIEKKAAKEEYDWEEEFRTILDDSQPEEEFETISYDVQPEADWESEEGNTDKTDGKKVFPGVLVFVVIGFLFIIFLYYMDDERKEKEWKEEETYEYSRMEQAMAEYLNEKYGEEYEAEDIEIHEEKEEVLGDYRYRYFTATTEEEEEVEITAYWRLTDTDVVLCFDNRQVPEIREAMQEAAQSLTGYDNMNLTTTLDAVNTYFDGDLKNFSRKERQMLEEMYGEQILTKERITVVAADPNCRTFQERWELEGETEEENLEQGWKDLEELCNQNVVGILVVEEYVKYYEKQAARKAAVDGGRFYTWSRLHSPVPDAFITELYISPDIPDYQPRQDGKNIGRIKKYPKKGIEIREGLYGFVKNADWDGLWEDSEAEGSVSMVKQQMGLMQVRTPDGIGLKEEEKEKAVTFRFVNRAGGENEWNFILDKERYGIVEDNCRLIFGEEERDVKYSMGVEDLGNYLMITISSEDNTAPGKEIMITVVKRS